MITENFSKYIKNLFDIQDREITFCESFIKLKTIPKGRVLVRSGEINKELYFVEQGLLRQYFVDKNGKEHILYFAPENWLLGDRNSSYFNIPTEFTIEAIEDTVVVILDPEFLLISAKNIRMLLLNLNFCYTVISDSYKKSFSAFGGHC